MSDNVNEYPNSLVTALEVYKSTRENLVDYEKMHSMEEYIVFISELIYPSMILANEFFDFYEKLIKKED